MRGIVVRAYPVGRVDVSLGKLESSKTHETHHLRSRKIKPFDATELQTHLKACKGAKKKDNLKEDVQTAVEASLLTK